MVGIQKRRADDLCALRLALDLLTFGDSGGGREDDRRTRGWLADLQSV
jgi:hypothetical protein